MLLVYMHCILGSAVLPVRRPGGVSLFVFTFPRLGYAIGLECPMHPLCLCRYFSPCFCLVVTSAAARAQRKPSHAFV